MCELADWYGENVSVPYKSVRFNKANHMFPARHADNFAEEVIKVLGQ